MNGEQLCAVAGIAPDIFFAPRETSGYDLAMALCAACPVQQACRDYARDEGVTHGIWGGESKAERERYWVRNGGRPQLFKLSIKEHAGAVLQERRDLENFDHVQDRRHRKSQSGDAA
jgi:hypothetical protein